MFYDFFLKTIFLSFNFSHLENNSALGKQDFPRNHCGNPRNLSRRAARAGKTMFASKQFSAKYLDQLEKKSFAKTT